jgi:abequosyltransferase
MTVRLSICIPTYNRAEFLPATLESIAAQWRDGLEITVADNASTDDTAGIVETFRRRLGAVRWFRWDANQGADRNYLKSVEISSGERCWILGSDDPISPGAIGTLLATFERVNPAIVLFNRMLCTRELTPVREDRFLDVGDDLARTYEFADGDTLERYLEGARSMCATFSYLSSMAFTRAAWDAATGHEPFIGSAYVHSYKLLLACARGARLEYVNAPLVQCRLGNDAFRDLGIAKRVVLDLDGYARLADACFAGRPRCAAALRAVLRHEYPFGRVLRYQGVLGSDPHWPDIVRRLEADVGHSRASVAVATLLGRSRPIVNFSFWLRDALARREGRRDAARLRARVSS